MTDSVNVEQCDREAAHVELAKSVTQRFIDARKEQDHANG